MNIEEVSSDWALTSQSLFSKPTDMHKNRDKFFELWRKKGFKKAVFVCTKPSIKQRIWRTMPESIRKKMRTLANI